MSEQENSQEVLKSLQQPTSFGDDNSILDSNPFSIRQYVLASRQKDLFHNWPFPEKYLQILQSRGISTALPPFESHHSALQSLRGPFNGWQKNKENVAGSDQPIHQSSTIGVERVSKEVCNLRKLDEATSERVSKEVCNLSKSDEAMSEICSQDCESYKSDYQNDCGPDVSPCNGVVSSAKRLRVKRKWGKGKHYKKKKSIVSILDVAMTRSSENATRIMRPRRGLSKPCEFGVIKECEKTHNGENICESDLTEDQCLKNKLVANNGCEGADTKMGHKARWVFVKYKLRNCSSRNSRSINLGGKGKKTLPPRRNGLRLRKS